VIGGYCAIGKVNSAIPPVRVMKMDSTAAKIGRSIKNREIMLALRGQKSGQRSEVKGQKQSRDHFLV
jgi:hypothetical protein